MERRYGLRCHQFDVPRGAKMLWQFMRDAGLCMFACGGILFVLGTIHRRIPNLPDPTLLKSIGDLMMLGGACLAVVAMTVGFFA